MSENELERRVEAAERRIDELESRLAEAGRRAVFLAEQHEVGASSRLTPASHAELANVGRALLFDTETPNDDADETPNTAE